LIIVNTEMKLWFALDMGNLFTVGRIFVFYGRLFPLRYKETIGLGVGTWNGFSNA
jgi:hypothetical protein